MPGDYKTDNGSGRHVDNLGVPDGIQGLGDLLDLNESLKIISVFSKRVLMADFQKGERSQGDGTAAFKRKWLRREAPARRSDSREFGVVSDPHW